MSITKRCICLLLVLCLIASHFSAAVAAVAPELAQHNGAPTVVSVSSAADPSDGMFTPGTVLTRGMFFYALWKHCGSPEPDVTERPYTDLDESDYYYDAVYWAVGAYIANGISTYEFNPDGYVLRGNAATFLYRALAGNNPVEYVGCPFTDVDEWDFYYDAVCWASEYGIMTSLDEEGLFQPDETCYYGDIYWDGSAPSVSNRQPDIDFEYVVYEDHVEITGCNSYATDIVIPATIEGLPVTSIGDKAFYDFYWLSSISIPDSVSFIGDRAFYACRGLTSISIPAGVTYIGDYAYYWCEELTRIIIPDGVTHIGNSAFYRCYGLTDVYLPDSVTFIGVEAFRSCTSLTNISIPAGVTHISDGTFYFCKELTTISIPDSVTSIGDSAFGGCSNLINISIPDSVTSIGEGAFYYCSSLTNIYIPKGVTSIGSSTFSQCTSLSSISIPDGVTKIGHYGFASCQSLTSITIPDGVTFIGECAFEFCNSLTSITIPCSVTILIDGALSRCSNLTSIYFMGDAPEFDLEHMGGVFYDVTATAYYPAGNPTWTADVLQNHGGTITWVPYNPNGGEIPSPGTDTHDTIDELTELDYLAFSNLVYQNLDKHIGKKVQDVIGNGWNSYWKEGNVTTEFLNSEIFGAIADWTVYKTRTGLDGFYSAAFKSPNNGQVILAYRGSTNPADMFKGSEDAIGDWIYNDLPMLLGGVIGTQFDDASGAYKDLTKDPNVSLISTTGHSLGGAWANAIAALYGCSGESMNAVPIIDVVYDEYPELYGATFTGVGDWSFKDHANVRDILAGANEEWFSLGTLKPFVTHGNAAEPEPGCIVKA